MIALLRVLTRKIILLACLICTPAFAAPGICSGKFVNPITDVDWSAMFPITIGAAPIWPNWNGLPDAPDNPPLPLCFCGEPIPRVGIEVGFWEPVRLVDVTYKPFCFVNLGGVDLDPGFNVGLGTQDNMKGAGRSTNHNMAQWQAHYYVYPLMYWLNLASDFACLEASDIDIAFITEIDPLWKDDAAAAWLAPENAAFANILAQSACMGDCTLATAKRPSDELFWCAGCWGPMLPMTGNTPHVSNLQSGKLVVARLLYFMHRTGLAWGTMGQKGVCSKYYMPVMRKNQYRVQPVNPVAMTGGRYSTTPIGSSTLMPKSGAVYPVKGEDQGYLIWRKRNCCVL